MPDTPVYQAQKVIVKEVWGEPESFDTKHGTQMAYKLTLEDGRFAAINQKVETPAPFAGQHLECDMQLLKEGGKMYRLFNVKREKGATFDYSQAPSQPSLQPVSKYEVQDVTQRLIIRQNALNRALECAVAMSHRAPQLSISETATIWVDFFEQLIWEAASPGHEQKVLEWAGVLEEVPAGGEGMSGVPTDPSDVTETSPPAGAGPPAEGHTVTTPQSSPAPEREIDSPGGSPREGGDVSTASPATLAQVLRNKRQQNVPDLVFSTFLTSMGVENVNLLSEDEAQLVLAWIANGDGQVAA